VARQIVPGMIDQRARTFISARTYSASHAEHRRHHRHHHHRHTCSQWLREEVALFAINNDRLSVEASAHQSWQPDLRSEHRPSLGVHVHPQGGEKVI